MKKFLINFLSLFFLISLCFAGCSVVTVDNKKASSISYEIIEYHHLNNILRELYDNYYEENNRITYNDGNYTYLLVFYGKMPISGYTIKVKELYSTDSNIVLDTTLIGPSKEETNAGKESFPAVVIKIKASEKTIIFK